MAAMGACCQKSFNASITLVDTPLPSIPPLFSSFPLLPPLKSSYRDPGSAVTFLSGSSKAHLSVQCDHCSATVKLFKIP